MAWTMALVIWLMGSAAPVEARKKPNPAATKALPALRLWARRRKYRTSPKSATSETVMTMPGSPLTACSGGWEAARAWGADKLGVLPVAVSA